MMPALRASTSTSVKWSGGGDKIICSYYILGMKSATKEVIIFIEF